VTREPHIFLVAGEPSGDSLGARLMAALREQTEGRVRFSGIGGAEMEAEGLSTLFPMHELSVMGMAEVVPRIPRLLRRIKETARAVRRQRPDAVVTIDSPAFSFRVCKRLQGAGIPLIHYVAPTVWAYAPERAGEIARFLDHLLAILPFEPPYFEAVGLPCTYVGNPVVEWSGPGDGVGFRRRHGIGAETPLLALLPGSRRSETRRLLPVFGGTAALLAERVPNLHIVTATVGAVREEVAAAARRWPCPVTVVSDPAQKPGAFAASDAAIAASGTVTLELAISRVPVVVAYRASPITAMIIRRLIRVDYVNLINLTLNDAVLPEFLQGRCRPDLLAEAAHELLLDRDARQRQIDRAQEALAAFGLGGESPSRRAAEVVLQVLTERSDGARAAA